ncbi:MAG: GntR family transcriptional regulator [Firmicutes bacterium]|nr:GntR family transcriptional regulator [Bacillota bacterium]
MAWNFDPNRPIYLQLAEKIETFILSGTYPAGAKIPSVRDLAKEAAVNPNTMQRALTKLEEDGLLITQRTSGRFVTKDLGKINKARHRLVQDQTAEFMMKMRQLGIEKEEVLEAINMLSEEMKR